VKRFLTALLASVTLLSGIAPARAVYGGKLAIGNTFSVAISGLKSSGGCTGFLYKPRIVLTAGHCLDQSSATNPMTVSPPGVSIPDDKSNFPTVITSFVSPNYFNDPNTGPPKFDFRVLVIDKELNAPTNIRLATNEDIEKLKATSATINFVGYGLPDVRNPYSLSTSILKDPLNMYQNYDTHPVGLLFDALNTKETAACNGDSGGPWVYLDGKTIVYLGATSTVNGYNPCLNKYVDSTNNYAEITSVANFTSVIQEAQDYVSAHPSVVASPSPTPTSPKESKTIISKKVTLFCVKLKKVVKVTNANPNCPKGYSPKK